jgi:hypothetical protein
MAEAADRQELLTALTTEHFTLQGARSQTMSESSSRTMLYIGAVSSALVALGFIGQVSQVGDAFDVFALTVLPTLYVLGAFTFIRVVECGAEDFRYGLAINRIRGYYRQLAGDQANLFLLSGHDDGRGVFENMGVPVEGRSQLFSFATVVGPPRIGQQVPALPYKVHEVRATARPAKPSVRPGQAAALETTGARPTRERDGQRARRSLACSRGSGRRGAGDCVPSGDPLADRPRCLTTVRAGDRRRSSSRRA